MKTRILTIALIISLLIILTGCGGGAKKGRLIGQTVDNFGAVIGGDAITIVLDGLTDIFHPGNDGTFDLSIPEGTYTIEFLWFDEDQGIEIYYQDTVTITSGQTVNMGSVPLSNSELSTGWASYRGGQYNKAITHFNNYLTDVRNGHATSGSNSAFNGLGWSYARLMNPTEAFNNLNAAVLKSGGSNADAYVGLGGLFLSVGYDGTDYTYTGSDQYFTAAIGFDRNYTSAPTHDNITETDLHAARALARFLDGDITGAQADITTANATIDEEGNFASHDTVNMLTWLIEHV
ncbi:MAG: hypothetical protein ABIG42_07450 [bacterium]